jgi:arginine decarboxylase-like protein
VKCNHDKELITTVLDCGAKFGWGLEVGSKPELLMGLSLLGQFPGSLLVCNGYKDPDYMRLVSRRPPHLLSVPYSASGGGQ